MGDPKKPKNKYSKPSHPWQAIRIEEEAKLKKDYGLKNKKEIWKAVSLIRDFKRQTKRIIAFPSPQSTIEEKQLLKKLARLNILPEGSLIEDVLNLEVTSILDRRLQTQVYKKELARSPRQARQFITHGHITIQESKVTVPSYLVLSKEEEFIHFKDNSKLHNEEHPERIILKKEKSKTAQPKEKDKAEKVEGAYEEDVSLISE